MRRGFANTRHGQIHYREDGEGAPLLLLHRTPLSSEEFAAVLPLLGCRHRAIAMDTIGYGDSDKPPSVYTMTDYARAVVDFLDCLGIERCHVLGEHTGAAIAAEVAAVHSTRVNKLVLSGFPLFTSEELVPRRKAQVPSHSTSFEPLILKPDGSHLMAAWRAPQVGLRLGDKTLTAIQGLAMAILKSGERNVEAHMALWMWDPHKSLPLIKSPTLILMSTEDQFYERAEMVRKMIAGSRVVTHAGGGFCFPHHAPEAYVQAVTRFLADA